MKLLAALVAVTLASPALFAQELEEAPGAAPMNTAPPPSSEELNDAVDQLSREKGHAPGTTKAPSAPKAEGSPLKHGKSFATQTPKKVKREAKKAAKAAKKGAKKAQKSKKKKH